MTDSMNINDLSIIERALMEEDKTNNTHGTNASHSTTVNMMTEHVHSNAMHMDHNHDSENTHNSNDRHSDHNPHDPGTGKHGEHSALLNLVKHSDATHFAVNDGSWFDPATWSNHEVPTDGARVVVMEGVKVDYDGLSDARLFTVRIDGELNFATDTGSKMVVDTLVVDSSGTLTAGTSENPVQSGVNVDIIIANNGDIDLSWDPTLLSRGVITHGSVEMHGQEKTTHLKVLEDPMAGDTSITLSEIPEGWNIGDTIVLAGTHYDRPKVKGVSKSAPVPEDEVLEITAIEGNIIHFDTPLLHDHDTPRDDLKTSVANYTRNISIESENGATSETHHRGHVMFMHNDDVNVRYVEFHELGRTDKSITSLNAGEFGDNIAADSSVKGRYSLHFHRTGLDDVDSPAIAEGNAVFGSPGWGIVHHDSNADIHNNATYNTFGAGYVAETGNEIGTWSNNIAIYAEGNGKAPKGGNDGVNFDNGRTGSGFFFQGRMVEVTDNVAASVNSGFTYWHRGRSDNDPLDGLDGKLNFDSVLFDLPEALGGAGVISQINKAPILHFSENETFASNFGLFIQKSNPNQNHDVRSVLQDFTAWEVVSGADLAYTSHYTLINFDLIGKTPVPYSTPKTAVKFGTNSSDIVIIDSKIDNFRTGFDISDARQGGKVDSSAKQHFIINVEQTNVTNEYKKFNPETFTVSNGDEIVERRFAVNLDGPLKYGFDGKSSVTINGTKIDSLGAAPIPAGADVYNAGYKEILNLLETEGYYSHNGRNYFILEDYYSDRITGEIHKFAEFVEISESVPLGNQHFPYKNAVYNGEIDINSTAPIAADDSAETAFETDVIIDILGNDTDPDGDTLRVDGITQPLYGRVFDNGDGKIIYRPGFDFVGTETIKYWATDNVGNYAPGTITIEVKADTETLPNVNTAPHAMDDIATIDEDTSIVLDLLINDGDADNDSLNITFVGAATHGTVELNDEGLVTYTPHSDFFGEDSFEYTITDGEETSTATVTVAVNDITDVVTTDNSYKIFTENTQMPTLSKQVAVNADSPALGVSAENMQVASSAKMILTFHRGSANYKSTLGAYEIGENGTIQNVKVYFDNVKDAGYEESYTVDLPTGEDGGRFGLFLIANGFKKNGGYEDLSITEEGVIEFIYDLGGENERFATIHDSGKNISVVYNDGSIVQKLNGETYHTTPRDESTALNPDGKAHVISGITNDDGPDVLHIGFEDKYNQGDADFEDVLLDIQIVNNATLIGDHGENELYGAEGNDILIGGKGHDTMTGGAEADTFVWSVNDVDGSVDTITDFSFDDHDVIDISDVLESYDPLSQDISDFVRIINNESPSSTMLSIDQNGNGNNFIDIAIINNHNEIDLETMINNGHLVV